MTTESATAANALCIMCGQWDKVPHDGPFRRSPRYICNDIDCRRRLRAFDDLGPSAVGEYFPWQGALGSLY